MKGRGVHKSRKASKPKSRKVKRVERSSPSFKVIVRYRPKPKKTFTSSKGTPPPKIRRLISKAKGYKKRQSFTSAQSRALNKRLEKAMAAAGYPPNTIERAKRYRVGEKVSIAAWSDVHARVERKAFKKVKGKEVLKSVRIDGKWITAARFKASVRMAKYNAQVRSYRERFGLTLKEARELWRGLRDEKFGQKIFQVLY